MSQHNIQIPPKLIPLYTGKADIRGSFGGRGSAKSWTAAKMSAVRGAMWAAEGRSGVILCVREFMNSLEDSSLADVKNAILSDDWLSSVYDVGEKYVRTKCGRVRYLFAGTSVNLDSIKSKSKILLCWAEEAENIKEAAWEKIVPTVREEGSEIWATWNPETERSWVHKNIRLSSDPNVKCAEINWRDNPWFTEKMERARVKHKRENPDSYGHVWEGEFKTSFKGAYYAADLRKAKEEGRIGVVPRDDLMEVRAFWDLGGTSMKSDATAIWIVQFIGQQINVLNYHEAIGQPMSHHVAWLRKNGYEDALCYLPHDGGKHDIVNKVTPQSALEDAGFRVRIIPNQGAGAASLRVDAARRLFNRIYFNEATTEAGILALQSYHEKWDDKRDVGLGPNHDWASHGADSFGYMAVGHESEPRGIIGDTENLDAGNYAGW